MRSIICPNCHTTIDIDESNYNEKLTKDNPGMLERFKKEGYEV